MTQLRRLWEVNGDACSLRLTDTVSRSSGMEACLHRSWHGSHVRLIGFAAPISYRYDL